MSATPSTSHEDPPNPEPPRPTRAAKACRRCHRKKLRCFGGYPCSSCKRAHQCCDFGDTNPGVGGLQNGEASNGDVENRFNQLENLVKGLLKKMEQDSSSRKSITNGSEEVVEEAPGPSMPQNDPSLGLFHYDVFPDSSELPTSHNIAHIDVEPNFPNEIPLPQFAPAPMPMARITQSAVLSQHSPEGRLAASQNAQSFGAPLRSLAFNPAHWDNIDRTRPPSPVKEPIEQNEHFWTTFDVRPGLIDDPLSLGIVDTSMAENLLQFFLRNCHRFMPFLEFARRENERLEEARQMGPYLFTTILALGARFKPRTNHFDQASPPALNPDCSLRLRRLAYAHFASSHFRRHQSLRDIQATLLLSGWGLHAGYEGPEAWMSTGHCGRLAHRLGLSFLGKTETSRTIQNKSPTQIAKLLSQWKTWLCWFCFDTSLEVGFGRPPMIQTSPDESGFLAIIEELPMGHTSVASSLYLAGLTRLTKIAKELSFWLHSLNESDTSNGSVEQVQPMLQKLNQRLDLWSQAWTWNGSSYHLRMGSFRSLLSLQYHHLRLSVNSFAIRPTFAGSLSDPESSISTFLTSAARSALDIIQAYIDSASGDGYFIFCLDYICLTIGHSLVFLIRLYMSSEPIPIERSVILHYLQLATDLLESSDLSVIGQASHIARTCRELCRAGDIPLPGNDSLPKMNTSTTAQIPNLSYNFEQQPSDVIFNGSENLDLGWILGLPSFGYADDPNMLFSGGMETADFQ